jgi:hypothetical protein
MLKTHKQRSEGTVHECILKTTPIFSSTYSTNASLSSPTTPFAAAQASDRTQFARNCNTPGTPFTRTLNYFKQYKGAGNATSKRRRNTALPQEIFAVAEVANSPEELPSSKVLEKSRHVSGDLAHENVSAVKLIIDETSRGNQGLTSVRPLNTPGMPSGEAEKENGPIRVQMEQLIIIGPDTAPMAALEETCTDRVVDASEPAPDDIQKQLILYPRHPTFVNVISMIPASMFWVVAAPVAKYTTLAVDLLIDKLRETYL